jgi:iron complex outermembrane receptor protein
MFRKTKVCTAIAVAVGASGLFAAPAFAQSSERIEITGSAIKRLNIETPAPIEIITRAEIARTGATSINELIKSISVIDINDQGEQSSNSPGGSGTSRIRLRGLGESQTLVLVNGRRVPKNPLADASGAGSAFNLNAIPVRAIERIEILKDGGSAIYGADAVAGVVNFILRKDYSGVTVGANYGESSRSDAAEQAVSAIAGWGDLSRDRFNVMAALDYFKRDPIYRKDRELSRSVDFRRFGVIPGYSADSRSVFAPEGNYLTPSGALAGQTVKPCPPESTSGAFCVFDFNASLLTSYNPADRISGLVNGTLQINPDTTAFARVIASESKDYFEAQPVPDFFVSPVGAPFPQYAGRFMQGGPRITNKKGTLFSLDAGVEGVWRNLDWKLGLTSGEAKTTNTDRNYYNRTLWNAATRNGSIDATSLNNDPALVESLKVSPVRTGKEKLEQVDGQVSGDFFKLPGGTARYAVGMSVWKESIDDNPDPLQVQNLVVGSIAQSIVSADRDAYALFAELQLPIVKTVEGQVALRYDDYDTASSTSPKVALKWQITPALALRGSYSKSFKVPTLKQQFASAGQGAITLTPAQCQQVGNSAAECANGLPGFRRTGSNPDLQPEFGKSYNFGVIAEAGPFSVSIDYFDVNKTDNISTLTLQSAIDNGFFLRDDQNRIVVLQDLRNFAQSQNTGVDVDARLRFRGLPIVGDFTLRGTGTYYMYQRTRTTSALPWAEFNGTYSTPRWRTTLTATSVIGPWTFQGQMRTVDGFYDTAVSKSGWTATTPGKDRRVPAHQEVDVTVSWEGIKNLKLTGSVKNVFDKMPPFSWQNAASNNYSQMGFAELYNVRGRFFQVGAEYTF